MSGDGITAIVGPKALADALADLNDQANFAERPTHEVSDPLDLAQHHYQIACALIEQAHAHLEMAHALQCSPYLRLPVKDPVTGEVT